VRERPPSYGNGTVLGALMANTFPLPLPPPTPPPSSYGGGAVTGTFGAAFPGLPGPPQGPPSARPLFNPNAALDPSQVEDRRGASTLVWRGIPQPVAPPFYQPWLLPAYHEALANWQEQVRGQYRGQR